MGNRITPPLLQVQGLGFAINGIYLWQNISFTIWGGDICHIIGDNGAGKTSLLRVILGLLPATDGQIYLNQRPINGNLNELHQHTHYIGAENALTPELTAQQHCQFMAGIMGLEVANIAPALEKLHLPPHIMVKNMSSGQKKRLNLCEILLGDKPIWFLDEPYNGLDAKGAEILSQYINHHQQHNGMVVIIHHGILPFTASKIVQL